MDCGASSWQDVCQWFNFSPPLYTCETWSRLLPSSRWERLRRRSAVCGRTSLSGQLRGTCLFALSRGWSCRSHQVKQVACCQVVELFTQTWGGIDTVCVAKTSALRATHSYNQSRRGAMNSSHQTESMCFRPGLTVRPPVTEENTHITPTIKLVIKQKSFFSVM